ncbi:Fic family protein [Paraflavisolibacter sp. H34]|uniref:Fic family protein n=1 Tax=Huijunlia imazamoxiresistens TaxID=3127457 RepID=UPI0030180D72
MARYIYQISGWPQFNWEERKLYDLLAKVRFRQGRLLGRMDGLGFSLREEALLKTITLDVLKSSEIEGEMLNPEQVRSSVARRLGIDIGGSVPADRAVEGVVEMMLDATGNYQEPLTQERLFGWHAALFPSGYSGMHKIMVGNWRQLGKGPMQVVSGPMGREQVHFEAPEASVLAKEMEQFLEWLNGTSKIDPVLKAGVAHLWFVTIHPFDDGNGRIARAIADMQLSRADESSQRFYSMSAQIRKERERYYAILEQTQKDTLDITDWLEWFLHCLNNALSASEEVLSDVLRKARFWEQHHDMPMNERQRLMVGKLMDGFVGKLTTSKWAAITKCSSDTALRDIQDLMTKGILAQEPGGSRKTSYVLIG